MKIVFVGLGGIGQRHLRNLSQLLGSQLDAHAFRSRRLTQVVSDKLEIVPDENIETKYGITVHDTWQQALEVGPDVVEAFGGGVRFVGRPRADGQVRWLADLPGLARDRLAAAGVRRVVGGAWCTVEDTSAFFSFRRDGVTGRQAAAIWLRG